MCIIEQLQLQPLQGAIRCEKQQLFSLTECKTRVYVLCAVFLRRRVAFGPGSDSLVRVCGRRRSGEEFRCFLRRNNWYFRKGRIIISVSCSVLRAGPVSLCPLGVLHVPVSSVAADGDRDCWQDPVVAPVGWKLELCGTNIVFLLSLMTFGGVVVQSGTPGSQQHRHQRSLAKGGS